MAFHKFVSAIQAARSVLFGRMNEPCGAGASHWWDVARDTTDIWLTPDTVRDYDAADFQYLPPEQQTELRSAVEGFRRLTEALRGSTPTEAQVQQGYELFAAINKFLAPFAGEEPDLRRIAEATRSVQCQWPPYVFGADFRIDTDWTDDPAVRIWLILNDDVEIESPLVQEELKRVRRAYLDAIQKAGIDRWPYVGVRTRSDTKDLVLGAA